MDKILQTLLEKVADLHGVPEGAYNIRANGQKAARNTTGIPLEIPPRIPPA